MKTDTLIELLQIYVKGLDVIASQGRVHIVILVYIAVMISIIWIRQPGQKK